MLEAPYLRAEAVVLATTKHGEDSTQHRETADHGKTREKREEQGSVPGATLEGSLGQDEGTRR